MAGVLQRLSVFETEAATRARMREVADTTMAVLLRERQYAPNGHWYWYYSLGEAIPNDLAHAGYIIHGIHLYAAHGGRLASKFPLPTVRAHLADYEGGSSWPITEWPKFRTDVSVPARTYDIGMGLFLVCTLGLDETVSTSMLQALSHYRESDGSYLKQPRGFASVPIVVREYETYVLLGLAACERR